MDGRFETPFANDGVHTYWPDGSFQYEREQASRGFLRHVRRIVHNNDENNNHHHQRVQTKVQYTNFDPPNGAWPEWARHVYRPGVSLLWREDDDDAERKNAADDNNNHGCTAATTGENHSPPRKKGTILVAQRTRGMHPPSDEWPKVEHWSLPIGKSVYFDRDGSRLVEDSADDNNSNNDRRFVMVTRMRVRPLETLTPPAELLEQNRNFLQQYPARHGGAEHAMEENLHRMLGGED